jgi:hypothetical protein
MPLSRKSFNYFALTLQRRGATLIQSPMAYLIDELLPEEEVCIVAGPTGSGKTSWLLEELCKWEDGHPVLVGHGPHHAGFASHPCSWMYAAADRTALGTLRTIERMSLDAERIPLLPVWDLGLNEITNVIEEAANRHAKLLVVEGFGRYAPEQANSKGVAAFLQRVYKALHYYHVTLIGVMESPKMKPRDKYGNPRQRVSGAAAWGHHTETIFLIEPYDEQHPENPMRWLYVCPRNAPSLKLRASLETGHFVIER